MKLMRWLLGDKVQKMLVVRSLPQPDYTRLEEELRKSELDRERVEARLQSQLAPPPFHFSSNGRYLINKKESR